MFGSNRKKQSKNYKFWPFGQKKASEDVEKEQPKKLKKQAKQVDENAHDHALPDAVQSIQNNGNDVDAANKEWTKDPTAVKHDNEEQQPKNAKLFSRIKLGLSKTRHSLTGGIVNFLVGKKKIDDELLESLETHLITADVGIEATDEIICYLTEQVRRKELKDMNALLSALKHQLLSIITPCCQPLVIRKDTKPYVILVVGVNGAGKTTTIGKMAKQFKQQGRSVLLAAGDTFRAAAVEQLQEWGSRNKISVIIGNKMDSASVVYDAYEAAKARQCDILIVDTAGRLHNKVHLMEELKKVKRVLSRLDGQAPHEVMLVLDACTGQNAVNQAVQFSKTVQLTGMTLTKLDGTAKGGIVFALAKKMQLPIRFIGVGEQIDDLQSFEPHAFIEALFDDAAVLDEMSCS